MTLSGQRIIKLEKCLKKPPQAKLKNVSVHLTSHHSPLALRGQALLSCTLL